MGDFHNPGPGALDISFPHRLVPISPRSPADSHGLMIIDEGQAEIHTHPPVEAHIPPFPGKKPKLPDPPRRDLFHMPNEAGPSAAASSATDPNSSDASVPSPKKSVIPPRLRKASTRIGQFTKTFSALSFDTILSGRSSRKESIVTPIAFAPDNDKGDDFVAQMDGPFLRFTDPPSEEKFNKVYQNSRRKHDKMSLQCLLGLYIALIIIISVTSRTHISALISALITFCLPIIILLYILSKFDHIQNYDTCATLFGLSTMTGVTVVNIMVYDSLTNPISVLLTWIAYSVLSSFIQIRYASMLIISAIHSISSICLVPLYHSFDFQTDNNNYEDSWKPMSIIFLFLSPLCSIASSRRMEYVERSKFITDEQLEIKSKKIDTIIGDGIPIGLTSFESPMDFAMRNLRDIANHVKDQVMASRIRTIIVLLSEYDLHAPVALKKPPGESGLDTNTKAWLRSEFRNSVDSDDIYQKMTKRRERTMSLCVYNHQALYKTDDLRAFLTSSSPILLSTMKTLFDSWNGDIFKLSEHSANKPLLFASVAIFERFQLAKRLNLNVPKFLAFVREIESGYLDNPYHTSCHAADVMINVMHLLASPKTGELLTDIDVLSVFLAAIIHDYAHTGMNNNFHIQSESQQSLMYNDKSVMENYHLYQAFSVMKDERFNFLAGVPREERKLIRDNVIELVLSTDMSYHFDYVGKFKAKITAGTDIDFSARENKIVVLQMALKCADLSHMAKEFGIHCQWTMRVTEEFYRQGDREASLHLPKSPFMDRSSEDVPKSQIGFLSFVVMPMFMSWIQYAGDTHGISNNLQSNLNRWKEMQQHNQLSLSDVQNAIDQLPESLQKASQS